jgi:hypothetical protein
MPGDPYWSNVVLLMGMETSAGGVPPGYIDESPTAKGSCPNLNNVSIDTSQKQCGASSVLMTGSSSGMAWTDSTDFHLTTVPFTVDAWVRFNSVAVQQFFMGVWGGSGNWSWVFYFNPASGGAMDFGVSTTGADFFVAATGAWAPTTGVWYFVSCDFDGTTYRVYVNGTMIGSGTTLYSINPLAGLLSIGSDANRATSNLNGWMDEIRLTKSVARYGGVSFTPTSCLNRGVLVSVPVVTNASFSLTLPVHAGQVVGVMTATNSPTSWSITAGNPSGFYAIDNLGNISITPAGATGITAGPASLTVQATNAAGSGIGTASITVNPAVPVGPAIYAVVAPTQLPDGTVVTCGTTLTEGANIPFGWLPPPTVDPLNTAAVNAFHAEGVQFLAYGFNQSYCQVPVTYWKGVPSAPGFYALTGLGAGLGAINMSSQTDIDQGGTSRQWTKVFMGPSVGWVAYPVQNLLSVTIAGTYVLDPSTNIVEVNVAGAVTIVLPSCRNPAVVAGAQAGLYVKNPIVVVDTGGNAASNNITITPNNVSETVMGLASIKIGANYGGFTLQPIPSQKTWTSISP